MRLTDKEITDALRAGKKINSKHLCVTLDMSSTTIIYINFRDGRVLPAKFLGIYLEVDDWEIVKNA